MNEFGARAVAIAGGVYVLNFDPAYTYTYILLLALGIVCFLLNYISERWKERKEKQEQLKTENSIEPPLPVSSGSLDKSKVPIVLDIPGSVFDENHKENPA